MILFTNMIHSKNSSFLNLFIWLKELDLFQNDSKNWTFSSKWLKNFVLWIWLRIDFFDYDSQKGIVLFTLTLTIEPFSKYDPKDWTFLIDWLIWSKGLFFLWWVTESNTFLNTKELNLLFSWRKELNSFFGEIQLNTFPIQRIEHSFWIRLTELNSFLECDSKNWTFFSQMSRRLELSFTNMSDRNNFFFLKKKNDSKNWFSENINQNIETLFWWLKELSFFFWETWLTELNHFFHVTHGIEPFFPTWLIVIESFFLTWLKELNPFWNMTQRVEKFSWVFDSKNWIFFEYDSKIWTFFFLNVTHRIEFFMTQRIEFFFVEYSMTKILLNNDSKNRTFFFFERILCFFFERDSQNSKNFFQYDSLLQIWIELIFSALPIEWNTWENDSKNWTFIAIKHDTKNWTSCEIKFVLHDPKNWTFSNMTQRIEPFWLDSKNCAFFWTWLAELSFFFFLKVTQRIEPFWKNDSKNWFSEKYHNKETCFWVGLKELTFLKNYSQNWNIFPCDS